MRSRFCGSWKSPECLWALAIFGRKKAKATTANSGLPQKMKLRLSSKLAAGRNRSRLWKTPDVMTAKPKHYTSCIWTSANGAESEQLANANCNIRNQTEQRSDRRGSRIGSTQRQARHSRRGGRCPQS